VLARVGIATIGLAAATALQLPAEVDVPGAPFLLYFVIVMVSAGAFGRIPGLVAVAETTIASVLYFDPVYSLRLTHAVDLLAIEIYSAVAALSVETAVGWLIAHWPKNRMNASIRMPASVAR